MSRPRERGCWWCRAAAFALAAVPLQGAQTAAPVAPDLGRFQSEAATLFNPSRFTAADSDFAATTANLLLCFQAVAVLVIVAGLLIQVRKEQTQLEGIAATMLKVAFIAALPALRDLVIEAADAVASSVGYQAVSRDGVPSPVMRDLWQLLGQWTPPSTPYLDALEAQSATALPSSGTEQEWGLRAWNWARGVGAADAARFHGLWQAASGSLRALLVFGSCGVMTCCLATTITLEYLGEILRVLLFHGGCAIMPLFIAGLSVDALRPACTRFVVGTVMIALWPIGWALANIVTHFIAAGAVDWMKDVITRALVTSDLPVTTLAVAAPYLAWGVLFLFVGVTIALCLWALVATFYVPMLMGRAASAGAGLVAEPVATSTSQAGSRPSVSMALQTRERAAPPTLQSSPARRPMPFRPPATARWEVRAGFVPIRSTLTGVVRSGSGRSGLKRLDRLS